jgi:hypothetical protein
MSSLSRCCRAKNKDFLPNACEIRGGGTLIKNLATLEHNKRDLLCSNVTIICRSITRGVEYPPARVGESVMNWIGVEGGTKSEIGDARFLMCGLTRSPPEFWKFFELIFLPDFFEKKKLAGEDLLDPLVLGRLSCRTLKIGEVIWQDCTTKISPH